MAFAAAKVMYAARRVGAVVWRIGADAAFAATGYADLMAANGEEDIHPPPLTFPAACRESRRRPPVALRRRPNYAGPCRRRSVYGRGLTEY